MVTEPCLLATHDCVRSGDALTVRLTVYPHCLILAGALAVNSRKWELLQRSPSRWIGGAALIPGRPWRRQWGRCANQLYERSNRNRLIAGSIDSISETWANPELKKSEVSRNFLSFGLPGALSTGS